MSDLLAPADKLSEVVISEIPEDQKPTAALVHEENIVSDSGKIIELGDKLLKNPSDDMAAGTLIDIVSQYLEAPQLLDPILSKLMKTLTTICLDNLGKQFPSVIYICISTLASIRGFRELLPLFPNEVEIFEKISNAFISEIPQWEISSVLCMWLAQLALVPFDIQTIQSPQLTEHLISKSRGLLSSTTRDSEMASFFLARLLSRSDMKANRDDFIQASIASFPNGTERLITNSLRALFYLITSSDRSWLKPIASALLDSMKPLSQSPSAHHRLFFTKIIQQIGLSYLPPRVAEWRYQKSHASDSLYQNEESFFVSPEVESILTNLFECLESNLTVVRWSASKGIGRIVERLPYTDATQAVDYLFSLFDHKENDNLMHGATLTLAQFTLRGLILPSNLSSVVPLVLSSLVYDVPRGSHSAAESVRDSGCFVCWAMARAYDKKSLEPFVTKISQQLTNVFLFDRSVNVRRSASAAFQENVGRNGLTPHGIELIHIADFLTVSSKSGCFTRIAPFVAQFPEYGQSIISHLVGFCLKHWDEEIRILAAKCLSIISVQIPDLITSSVIDEICVACSSFDVDVKHGGLEALGSILRVRKVELNQIEPLFTLSSDYQIENIKGSFVKMITSAAKQGHCVPNLGQTMSDWLLNGTPLVQTAVVDSIKYLSGEVLKSEFYENLLGNMDNVGVAAAACAFPPEFLRASKDKVSAKMIGLLKDKATSIGAKQSLIESSEGLAQYFDDNTVIEILRLGMNDRTITKKGDEGTLIRSASLKVSRSLLQKMEIGGEIMDDVLRLCLDRITGVRDLAVGVLRDIVQKCQGIPQKDKLETILRKDAICLEDFTQLIDADEYSAIVVEGLILCSGALAPDLSKHARSALLSFMRKKDAMKIGKIIVVLSRRLLGNATFMASVLDFVPLFVGNRILTAQNLNEFSSEFIEIIRSYLAKSNYTKMLKSVKALSALSGQCDGEQQKMAFGLLAPFFVCEFANVRSLAATELYTRLKMRDAGPSFNLEDALALLTEKNWKDDFEQCADGCTRLCSMFRVPTPKIEKKEGPAKQGNDFSYRLLATGAYK